MMGQLGHDQGEFFYSFRLAQPLQNPSEAVIERSAIWLMI